MMGWQSMDRKICNGVMSRPEVTKRFLQDVEKVIVLVITCLRQSGWEVATCGGPLLFDREICSLQKTGHLRPKSTSDSLGSVRSSRAVRDDIPPLLAMLGYAWMLHFERTLLTAKQAEHFVKDVKVGQDSTCFQIKRPAGPLVKEKTNRNQFDKRNSQNEPKLRALFSEPRPFHITGCSTAGQGKSKALQLYSRCIW